MSNVTSIRNRSWLAVPKRIELTDINSIFSWDITLDELFFA